MIVRLYGDFLDAVGTRDVYLWLDRPATVGDALARLVEKHPAVGEVLYADGEIRGDVHVVHNRREVWEKHGLETAVSPEDELALFSPVGEG
ncbi:MAG: ubiquitin-like small modifier protein 1 [Haloferacaceae archaeon]